jgi:hypothetical protein
MVSALTIDTYDSQGRMKTMQPWQSVSGGTYAITTWNYDGRDVHL